MEQRLPPLRHKGRPVRPRHRLLLLSRLERPRPRRRNAAERRPLPPRPPRHNVRRDTAARRPINKIVAATKFRLDTSQIRRYAAVSLRLRLDRRPALRRLMYGAANKGLASLLLVGPLTPLPPVGRVRHKRPLSPRRPQSLGPSRPDVVRLHNVDVDKSP